MASTNRMGVLIGLNQLPLWLADRRSLAKQCLPRVEMAIRWLKANPYQRSWHTHCNLLIFLILEWTTSLDTSSRTLFVMEGGCPSGCPRHVERRVT